MEQPIGIKPEPLVGSYFDSSNTESNVNMFAATIVGVVFLGLIGVLGSAISEISN